MPAFWHSVPSLAPGSDQAKPILCEADFPARSSGHLTYISATEIGRVRWQKKRKSFGPSAQKQNPLLRSLTCDPRLVCSCQSLQFTSHPPTEGTTNKLRPTPLPKNVPMPPEKARSATRECNVKLTPGYTLATVTSGQLPTPFTCLVTPFTPRPRNATGKANLDTNILSYTQTQRARARTDTRLPTRLRGSEC